MKKSLPQTNKEESKEDLNNLAIIYISSSKILNYSEIRDKYLAKKFKEYSTLYTRNEYIDEFLKHFKDKYECFYNLSYVQVLSAEIEDYLVASLPLKFKKEDEL